MATIDKTRLKGNQLAVLDITSTPITQQRKQQIAREFSFSETVFLQHGGPGRNPLAEIFTPVNEMEFAGHPVIGTGHVLFQELLGPSGTNDQRMTLETKAGPVAIEYDPDAKVVYAGIPHNIHVHSKETPVAALASIQSGLAAADPDSTYPTVSIVKGVTYVLADLTENTDTFSKLTAGPSPSIELDGGWSPSFAGTMYYRILQSRVEGEMNVWNVRVRMIAIDLEDPACGSGGCTLGAYLALQKSQQCQKHRFYIDQGSEIGRDSRIIVEIILNAARDRVEGVHLAGQAALVTQGRIFLD